MESTLEATEAVARYAARVEIALQAGFYDLARRIIDEAELSATSPPAEVTLDTSLADVGLPVRVLGLLEWAEIHTVGDALNQTPAELAKIPSLGELSIRAIIATLRSLPIAVDSKGV